LAVSVVAFADEAESTEYVPAVVEAEHQQEVAEQGFVGFSAMSSPINNPIADPPGGGPPPPTPPPPFWQPMNPGAVGPMPPVDTSTNPFRP